VSVGAFIIAAALSLVYGFTVPHRLTDNFVGQLAIGLAGGFVIGIVAVLVS